MNDICCDVKWIQVPLEMFQWRAAYEHGDGLFGSLKCSQIVRLETESFSRILHHVASIVRFEGEELILLEVRPGAPTLECDDNTCIWDVTSVRITAWSAPGFERSLHFRKSATNLTSNVTAHKSQQTRRDINLDLYRYLRHNNCDVFWEYVVFRRTLLKLQYLWC
jgi:hypothetical protein